MVMDFIPLGVFVAALVTAVWAIWATVHSRVGQILDALYGQPRPETSAARWRRVHQEADRRSGVSL